MKNKAVVILKLMTTLVIVLIGVIIWLFLNQPQKEKTNLPKEPVIKEENLDIHSELVKNLSYPDMQDSCNNIDTMGRYKDNELKVEDIELSEKIDTAYKKLAPPNEGPVSSITMRQYVESYWGKIENYRDFSFSTNDTNYIYHEEEQSYDIEIVEEEKLCEQQSYVKRFVPVLFTATKKDNQIILDYVMVYYIEDSSNKSDIVFHIYQDKEFTNYIKTITEKEFDTDSLASKYQSKLEHYTFIFEEKEKNYYFKEAKKRNEVKSLEEIQLTDTILENINILSLEDFCFDFDENSVYQKNNFSLENMKMEVKLLLAFHHAYKNNLLDTEKTIFNDRIEYMLTEIEAKNIYKDFWGQELQSEIEDFDLFGYKGNKEENGYLLVISSKEVVCPTTRKYVDMRQEKIYKKEDIIYIDYKIRFITQKGNNFAIYQDKNYENLIKENIRSKDIQEEYWDFEYVTYRFVFKKQENGKYYFLEGLYI